MRRLAWALFGSLLLAAMICHPAAPVAASEAPPPDDSCTVTASATYVEDTLSSYFGVDYTGSFNCGPGAAPTNRTLIVRVESYDLQSYAVQGGDYRSTAACNLKDPLSVDDQLKLPDGDMVRIVIVGVLKDRCLDNIIRDGDPVYRAYSKWIYLPRNQQLA